MTVARLTFPKKLRLLRQSQFDAVYQAKQAVVIGPLRILGLPNSLPHCRLGLNVSKRVGGAVQRNRVKRHLREAFRLMQHELPPGMDLLVIARAAEGVDLDSARNALMKSAEKLRSKWGKIEERK